MPYPVAGTVTVQAITEVALVEAVVHHLDLHAAVGGALPPQGAMARVIEILEAITDRPALIDALTGRGPAPLR